MNTFESYEPRSHFGMMVGAAFAVAAALGIGVFLLISSPNGDPAAGPVQQEPEPEPIVESEPFDDPPEPVIEEAKPLDPFNAEPEPPKVADNRMPPPTPEELLVAAGMGLVEFDPEVLLRKIGASLEQSDVKQATTLIGRKALDEAQLEIGRAHV